MSGLVHGRLMSFGFRVSALLCVGMMAGCATAHAFEPRPVGASEKVAPMTAASAENTTLTWYAARQLTIEGKGWTDTPSFFRRLPERAKDVVTPAVWRLSSNTAGICVRFVSDADAIWARVKVTSKNLALPHMPASGTSGLDLYVYRDGQYRCLHVGRLKMEQAIERPLLTKTLPGLNEYLLYLPLYNGIEYLEIGVPRDALMGKPLPRPADRAKPICFYGTSIMQGGCASRPGMSHVAIIGRWLDRPVMNFGFSGAGKMEPAMADLFGELDVAAYVLDCLPNMSVDMVNERVEPFVLRLRKARPKTPILLVESTTYPTQKIISGTNALYLQKNIALKKVYQKLLDQDVAHLHYLPGENLIGPDGQGTVDGTHLTDLGFHRFAQAMTPVLRDIVE